MWQGACMAGGVHVGETACQGAYMVEGMHGRGHVWQCGMCSRDHA